MEEYKCGYGHLIRDTFIAGMVSTLLVAFIWREVTKSVADAVRFPPR